MRNQDRRTGAIPLLILSAAALGTTGQQCAISFPPPTPPAVFTTVDVELVNNTADAVDPGLFVDDVAYILDPPLAPGESFVLTVDCFEETTLLTDALLLDPAGAFPSDNVPLLVEGANFFCGDLVTFVFVEDAFGFFTQVLVNDVVVAP